MSIIITQEVKPLKCQRCNHIWNYKGKNEYVATCPHCSDTSGSYSKK